LKIEQEGRPSDLPYAKNATAELLGEFQQEAQSLCLGASVWERVEG
jgi:hypothetical protein